MNGVCRVCRNPLRPGDVVQQLWVYDHYRDGQVYTTPEPEVAHGRCDNPSAPALHPEVPRGHMKLGTEQPLPKRSPTHQCLFCGKVYARGHRFVILLRARSVQHDPVINAPNVLTEGDWETGHYDCNDPELKNVHSPLVLA